MSRQTDDGLHEGYLAVELTAPWPDGYATFYERTGSWWTSTWSRDRPAITGRCQIRCDHHHHGHVTTAAWCGPIFDLVLDDWGDPTSADEDMMFAWWKFHLETIRAAAAS